MPTLPGKPLWRSLFTSARLTPCGTRSSWLGDRARSQNLNCNAGRRSQAHTRHRARFRPAQITHSLAATRRAAVSQRASCKGAHMPRDNAEGFRPRSSRDGPIGAYADIHVLRWEEGFHSSDAPLQSHSPAAEGGANTIVREPSHVL